jgi:hypothetical protein
MKRSLDLKSERYLFNPWVLKSIDLFHKTDYLDRILSVYPLQSATPERLDPMLRRKIIAAHQARNTSSLLKLLQNEVKFPYDEPVWFLGITWKTVVRKIRNRWHVLPKACMP